MLHGGFALKNCVKDRSVPSNFMLDIEYSVITSEVIKRFDCSFLVDS